MAFNNLGQQCNPLFQFQAHHQGADVRAEHRPAEWNLPSSLLRTLQQIFFGEDQLGIVGQALQRDLSARGQEGRAV